MKTTGEGDASFVSLVSSTKPLPKKHTNVYVNKPKTLITPQHPPLENDTFQRVHLTDWDLEKSKVQSSEIISYQKCHFSKKQWRAFTQGHGRALYCLDLHGLDRENAWEAVQAYVDDLYCRHIKLGLIIHGKGNISEDGIANLKNMLAQHLQKLPHVLAYHSAMPKDGGSGALYVMIQSK